MSPTNIAVIGAGYWGKKVISEILGLARDGFNLNLYSVVDSSQAALELCRKEYGQLDYRTDYQDLLTDTKLSCVHIASPNHTHFKVASDFIRNGKHVLVEKPLSLKSVEAFELGTGLLASQPNREVITDLGPHPFDICNNLLDTWPRKISCRGRGFRTNAGYEMADIYAEHPNGLDASIELSWLDLEKRRDVSVIGSDGAARLDCLGQRLILQRTDGAEPVLVLPNNTLKEEIIHFMSCVEHSSSPEVYPNMASGELGASVVRLLEASKRSLEEDRTVRVEMPRVEDQLIREHLYDLSPEPRIRGS